MFEAGEILVLAMAADHVAVAVPIGVARTPSVAGVTASAVHAVT